MAETPKEESMLEYLLKLREILLARKDKVEADLATCEKALAEARQNESGETIEKGRIVSLTKQYILKNGPSPFPVLRKHVIEHGGIPATGDFDKRMKQSLSRCVTSGTMTLNDDKYDLSDKERRRMSAK